mgnify:CR=1 FL=1
MSLDHRARRLPMTGRSIPHVLGKLSKEEEPLIAQAIQDAVAAVQCLLEESIDVAMNRYNVIGNQTGN